MQFHKDHDLCCAEHVTQKKMQTTKLNLSVCVFDKRTNRQNTAREMERDRQIDRDRDSERERERRYMDKDRDRDR
jgi:uncharacterized protein (UPF0218 family)